MGASGLSGCVSFLPLRKCIEPRFQLPCEPLRLRVPMGSRLGRAAKFLGKDLDSAGFRDPRRGGSKDRVFPRCLLKKRFTIRLVPEMVSVGGCPRPRRPFMEDTAVRSLSAPKPSLVAGKSGIWWKLLRGEETWDVDREPEDIGDCGRKRKLSINELR